MLEKQRSVGQLLPSKKIKVPNRRLCLQRQKSRQLFKRQHTFQNLSNTPEPYDVNNNTETVDDPEFQHTSKVHRLLLKHTKFGFIKSFANLSINDPDETRRTISESDQVIQKFPSPDDILQEPEISAKIINKESFHIGQLLGSGGFGAVYLGIYKDQKVAIKVMHKYTKNPTAQVESFKAELLVMRFHHPNIVQTLAATHIDQFGEGAWVIMEYVNKSTLQTLLNETTEEFNAKRRLKYAIQLASALAYAHSNKIAHLDLKPSNVLITESDDCKIGDFGCCQQVNYGVGIESPSCRSALTGTFAYRAPELLKGEPPTFKADIYSYGVTLWQLKSRDIPYANHNPHVVIFGVVANGLRPTDPNPSETDPFELSYRDLYQQCWKASPLNRPSARELVDLLNIWKENL
ncbi:hypothetical protein ACF0H5_005211 [Mactra antiquata]